MQLGGEAVAGVLEVHVGRADRRHARLPLRRDPQHPAADRPAQPLLARAGVERAPERRHVEPDRADALGPVEQDRDVQRRQARRTHGARDPAHVRARDQLRPRADGVGEIGERHRADVDAAPIAQRDQRPEQAGVLVGRGQHLVAGAEVHPGQHADDAVARARGQRDVGDLGPEHRPRRPRAGGRAARGASRRTPSRARAQRRGRACPGSARTDACGSGPHVPAFR